MSKGAADRKVGIVAFNNDVTIIGDGLKDHLTITGDKLFNCDYLTENGEKEGARYPLFEKQGLPQNPKTPGGVSMAV